MSVQGSMGAGMATRLAEAGFELTVYNRNSDRVSAAGRPAVDACVLGNPRHARDGELRFMIGGDEADVAALRPVLNVLAKEVVHVGTHGMGATAASCDVLTSAADAGLGGLDCAAVLVEVERMAGRAGQARP
jgi:3-hydroxyisobutyrate dehydrogenase-like beta-hydroxyacid dehydrogenase